MTEGETPPHVLGVGEGQTGLLQTALTLPFILFAIPAGLLPDRISRRWVMAASEALRAAALVAGTHSLASRNDVNGRDRPGHAHV